MKACHLAVAALVATAPLAATGQPALDSTPPPEAWTGDATVAQPDVGDAARAYERAIGQLRQDLPLGYTGDLHADYALRAQALATAARDLAEAYLAETSEKPEADLRATAQAITEGGQASIDDLAQWLAENPHSGTVPEPDTTVPQTGDFVGDAPSADD